MLPPVQFAGLSPARPPLFPSGPWRAGLALAVLAILCIRLTSCAAPPATGGSCDLSPVQPGDEEAIRAVIEAEGAYVVTQQIDALMALWAESAYISNAKNTPTYTDDDQFWRDKDAIRHRYVRTVFPGAPAAAAPADLQIQIDGNQAEHQIAEECFEPFETPA